MSSRNVWVRNWATIVILGFAVVDSARAIALKNGDIMVAFGTNLREYSPTGNLDMTLIPGNAPSGINTWEGVTVTADGNVHILNQQANSYLTTNNPVSNTTRHDQIPGMNLAGVSYYGNIGHDSNYVYVPDISTDLGDPQGIVRFPLINLANPQRFATNVNPYAVAVGLNGMIYDVDSPNSVNEWDPVTLNEIKSYSLTQTTGSTQESIEDVAVDASGNLYTINNNSEVYKYSADGNQLQEIQIANTATSIDLLPSGELILGSIGGRVTFTNVSNLASSTSITFSGVGTVFATDIRVPEPGSAGVLLALGAFGIARRGTRR